MLPTWTLIASQVATAAPSCGPVDAASVVHSARDALVARQWREVRRIAQQWQIDAPCVAETVSPADLVRPFHYAGIAAYEARDRDEARAWFITALTLSPNEELDQRALQRIGTGVGQTFSAMSAALAGAASRATLRICTPASVDGVHYQTGDRVAVYNGTHLVSGLGLEPSWLSVSSDMDNPIGVCPTSVETPAKRNLTGSGGLSNALGQSIAAIALEAVGHNAHTLLQRPDCSGLMEYILGHAGLHSWVGSVADMFRIAQEAEVYWTDGSGGAPGDLVYFRNTHDRNHNGLLDDEWTHIAVVVGTSPDGTLKLVHKGGQTGISVIKMNLSRRGDRDVNSQLRIEVDSSGRLPVRTTGETFAAMASPWRAVERERP